MHIIFRDEYGTIGIRGDTKVNLFGIDDLIIGSAAASLGSSVIGGIFGSSSQKDTNATNLQIARETNEQNYKIWQEQKEHNIDMFNMENQANIDMFNMENQAAIDMWNMQNAYNDPSAQAERLLNAGFNPQLALTSSTAAGNATSAPSVGSLSSASATPAQAPTMQGTTVTSPFQVAWQNAMQGIQTMVDGINKAALMRPTIDNLNSGTNVNNNQAVKLGFEANYQKIVNKYAPTLFAEDVETKKYNNDLLAMDVTYGRETRQLQIALLRADFAYKSLDIEKQTILNAYLPGEKQLDMMTKGVMYSNLVLDGKMKAKDLANYFTRYLMVNIAHANALNSQKEGQDIKNESDKLDLDNKKAFLEGFKTKEDGKILESLGGYLAESMLFDAELQDTWINPTREIDAIHDYKTAKRRKTGVTGYFHDFIDQFSEYGQKLSPFFNSAK